MTRSTEKNERMTHHQQHQHQHQQQQHHEDRPDGPHRHHQQQPGAGRSGPEAANDRPPTHRSPATDLQDSDTSLAHAAVSISPNGRRHTPVPVLTPAHTAASAPDPGPASATATGPAPSPVAAPTPTAEPAPTDDGLAVTSAAGTPAPVSASAPAPAKVSTSPGRQRLVPGSSADRLASTRSLEQSIQEWAASGGVLWFNDRLEPGPWTTLIDGPLRMHILSKGTQQVFPHSPAWSLDISGFMPRIDALPAAPERAPTVLVPAGRAMVTIKALLDWSRRGVARCWLHEPTGWEILDLEPLLSELLFMRRVQPALRKVFPGLVLDEATIVMAMGSRMRIRRRRKFGLQYAGAFLPDLAAPIVDRTSPHYTPRRAFRAASGREIPFAPGGPELWHREIEKDNAALEAHEAGRDSDVRLLTALPAEPGGPLRVMHYVGSLNSGGAERQLCNLAIGLQERGHEVRVRTAYELTGELGHYLPLLEAAGVDTTHASAEHALASAATSSVSGGVATSASAHAAMEVNSRSLRWDLLAAVPDHLRPFVTNLACELLAFRPHILHAWLDHPNMLAGMAGIIAGVPRILFSTRNSNPRNFPRLHSPELDTWYAALTPSRRIHWLANSHSGAISYADYARIPVERIHVVLNGVFREHFAAPGPEARAAARAKFNLPTDVPVVAIINRLSEEKQPELALKVISMVRADVPDLRVLLAGAGPLEDRVREIIQQRGLESTIQLLGRVRDVDSIFVASDCLLLTSTLEGCPNVALEAQHAGIPVVATRGGGTVDAVVHERTGLLCGVTDATELTLALRRILTDATLRAQFGRDAQLFVDECFGIDQMVDLTRAVYDVMIAARHDQTERPRIVTPPPRLPERANEEAPTADTMAATAADHQPDDHEALLVQVRSGAGRSFISRGATAAVRQKLR